MRASAVRVEQAAVNPLDMVEEIVHAHDWAFDRRSDEEMAVEVPGHWSTYSLYFAWSEELRALHLSSAMDIRVPDRRRAAMYEVLAMINERLWLGHFALWDDESMPMFRHSVLVRGGSPLSQDHVEDLVDVAMNECERYYPVFQFVIWGGKSAREALTSAMLDTVGEA
ncbi:MAG: YbjN domain-containing protein [Alphaproteobacteria bacterium]